ncbi:MAG: acyl carrier protein [Lachnospiraceae bacterium]|nr:acyl carrier protein [Lachnospiraceae bacterium]
MTEILDKILMEVNSEIVENKEIDLIEEGVITSLDLISIVAEIEEELQVEIELEDIVADNFTSYAAIEKLFLKYLSA